MPRGAWVPRYRAALLMHTPTNRLGREIRRVRNGRIMLRWIDTTVEEWVKLSECAELVAQELPAPSTMGRIYLLYGIMVGTLLGKILVVTPELTKLGWLLVEPSTGDPELGELLECRYHGAQGWIGERITSGTKVVS